MNYSLLKLSFGGFTGYTFSNYLGKQTLLGTLQTALKYVFMIMRLTDLQIII